MSWIPGWDSVATAGWWSGFYFWISIVCLIGLGVAEVVSHRYEGRKDQLAAVEEAAKDKRHDEDMARVEHDTAQANERAARLEKEAAQANAEVAKANATAAAANERAAALEKEAANARLEQERLKAQMAWRTIDPAMAAVLKAALAAKPGKINIKHPNGDTEAEYLAIQFGKIFSEAKWQIGMFSEQMPGIVAWGLFVPDTPSDQEATVAIRDSLRSAGFSFSTEPLQQLTGTGFGSLIPSAATFFIGSKPPPQ
jgi:hypothetical protein